MAEAAVATGVRLRPFGVAAEKFGEGAGRPGSPGACCVYRFDETAAPRRRFPRACRPPALFGPCRRPDGSLRTRPRGDLGAVTRRGPAQEARGEQEDAIHRRPQGPPA